MSLVVDLFGMPVDMEGVDWKQVIADQHCPFAGTSCYKIRKSESHIAIGTCTVKYVRDKELVSIMICPNRLLQGRKIFKDAIHLLQLHQPGYDFHVVPEVTIPGGNVDYFLVSADRGRVKDFVGIELQTLDTTGTVWPARQKLLSSFGLLPEGEQVAKKGYGMNWKMTAKTILVQLHHKIGTFEALNKHLVLVVQDHLLTYMQGQFSFDHLGDAVLGHSMHFHPYSMTPSNPGYSLQLGKRLSTDEAGIATALGLQGDSNVAIEEIVALLESKMSDDTILTI